MCHTAEQRVKATKTAPLSLFSLIVAFSTHRVQCSLCTLHVRCMRRYLGDRRSFQRDVARPVRAALSSDGDGRATVEGLQELEKLHRQAGRPLLAVVRPYAVVGGGCSGGVSGGILGANITCPSAQRCLPPPPPPPPNAKCSWV